MYLLNGESKHCVEISDRGFQYGDGLFETIEILDRTPVFLDQHLLRLQAGCKRLKIPSPDLSVLAKEAFQLSQTRAESSRSVLKIIVTRGSGGRGYRQPESIQPTRLLSIHPFPEYPTRFFQQGVKTRICTTRLGRNPLLAGIKHMNRLEQIMARAEWQTAECQEGMMFDCDGNLIEGTMTNVFLIKDSSLFTPLLDQSGVAGIVREIILSLAKENNISVYEKIVSREELLRADEVFLSNSIIGIWPVNQLEQQTYSVGTVTKKIIELLSTYKDQHVHVC